jgi:hypothetical protein
VESCLSRRQVKPTVGRFSKGKFMSMPFREFNYFFFDPISFDVFYDSFKSSYDFQSMENARRVFNDWIIYFSHVSYLFYRAQYAYHQSLVEKDFLIENQIPEGHSFSEYGLDGKWEYFSSEKGLAEHYDQYESWCSRVESMASRARYENNIPDSFSIGELGRELIKAGDEISHNKRPSTKAINEVWFNSIISNSSEIAFKLRNTPYPDYLYTKHWQKVRAAMMVIHKGSCQAEGCYEQFESWYFGWEPEIDVHHLHYRSKGNERYADLALLCKAHHKLWHYNQDNGKPQIKILDADWH